MAIDVHVQPVATRVERAENVRKQLGVWRRFVAMFGVASVLFTGLGVYGMHSGGGSPQTIQASVSACAIGLCLAIIAMMWRCVHSTAEVTIQLLEEITERLPEVAK